MKEFLKTFLLALGIVGAFWLDAMGVYWLSSHIAWGIPILAGVLLFLLFFSIADYIRNF